MILRVDNSLPADALELSLLGLDSPGLPLESAESTISLDSALALSRASTICTLLNSPRYNLVTQYRYLSPAHSTLAQEPSRKEIAGSGSPLIAQRLSWKTVAESGSPHSTGTPLEEGSRAGLPHGSETRLEEGS